MSRSILPLAVLVALACGDSGSGPSNGLTDSEVQAILPSLVTPGLSLLGTVRTGNGPALVPVDIDLDRTFACPLGGGVHVAGGVSGDLPESGTGNLELDVLKDFDQCRFEAGGRTWTVTTGGPLQLTGDIGVEVGQASDVQTIELNGEIELTPDEGDAFTCDVDLDVSLTFSVREAVVSGDICDRSVGARFTWTVN
jgi:hypothetical protein